ncbi:MAG: histidinol-phosphatase HisJ family protein [Clostridia bacterium]
MLDTHTHTKFSHDGRMSLYNAVIRAREMGLKYFAATEHLDRDYYYCSGRERFAPQLNIKKYLDEAEKIREVAGDMLVAFGVECGYSLQAQERYKEDFEKYNFDLIINSVHTVNNRDMYFLPKNDLSNKEPIYRQYLLAVLDSVKNQIDYDIVGHLGYVARYVGFDNRNLYEPQFVEIVDEILTEIIARGKTLEMNTRVKDIQAVAIPEEKILVRYRELGGENISFGSDAHSLEDIAMNYTAAAALAKKVGFSHWTAYIQRKPIKFVI